MFLRRRVRAILVRLALYLVVGVASGYLVHFAGYRENTVPSRAAMAEMRHIFIWSQVAGMAVCAGVFWFFPLTRERMAEIRAALDERRKPA